MRKPREGATVVEELRVEKRLTQAELAQVSGVSRMTIINIEARRNTNPSTKTLIALAKALDTTAEVLYEDVGGEGSEDSAT